MPSKIRLVEHIRKAAELLYEVAHKSPHNHLRARAYSQLAVMRNQEHRWLNITDCSEIFKCMSLQSLVDEAVKYGPTDAKTLEECGRSLRYTDLRNATRLLEESLKIKKHSIAYHHLGLCYERQAKNLYLSKLKRSSRNNQGRSDWPRILRIPFKEEPLNKSEPLVDKAITCFKDAIKISCDNNNPACYSLGLILRACGEFESALSEFNKIIRANLKSDDPENKVVRGKRNYQYLLTVACSYEEAGLCLLEMAKQPGKTEKETLSFNKSAEEKLMQAVSLAANLSNLDSEMDRYRRQMWNAFETQEAKYNAWKNSPEVIKNYINLLMIVSNYEKVLQVIEDLRRLSPEELADSEVIKSRLESYLGLNKHEAAYTFLCVSITSPFFKDDGKLESVSLKVRLYTAAARLQAAEGNAKDILKPLFHQYTEKGNTDSVDGNQGMVLANSEVTDGDQENDALDVLIFYDTVVEATSVELKQMAKKLQKIISDDFDLHVSRIVKRQTLGHLPLNDQVEEISTARLVLMILSSEPHSPVLERIPTLMDCKDNSKHKPIILLGSANDGVEVTKLLKPYNHIPLWNLLDRALVLSELEEDNGSSQSNESLYIPETSSDNREDVGHASNLSPAPANAASDVEKSQSSSGEFDDCVVAKMSLFCALINKEWPPECL